MRYAKERKPVLTLTAGPVDAYPEVLQALGRTVLYDFDPAFLAFYEKVARKAQAALGTKDVPVILHGEPVLGLEHVRVDELTPVADEQQSRLMGFEPCYHFATWECLRP